MYRWVIVLALLVACASEQGQRFAEPQPTPSQSFLNGGECELVDGGDLPGAAGCITEARSDDAVLTVYAFVSRDNLPRSWRIRHASAQVTIDEHLKAGNPFSYPRAIAAIDVNGDGVQEWLIKNVDLAGHGTNWQRLELLIVDGPDLVPVTLDGELFYVNVGGISRMGEGARCEGDRFVLLRTWALDRQNTRWAYSERFYEIEGAKAKFLRRRESRYRVVDYNDPKIDPFYRLECGDLVYP